MHRSLQGEGVGTGVNVSLAFRERGQTFARVGVDTRADFFTHGHLYVAMGRAQASKDMIILTYGKCLFVRIRPPFIISF